jgi:apolipoprotein N-acyltransferase
MKLKVAPRPPGAVLKILELKSVVFLGHAVCGLALALALPPHAFLWSAAAGLVGLLFLNRDFSKLRPLHHVGRGVAFGLGYFCFALHWIGYAFFVDADAFLWMMPFAVGGLSLFMALYWGVAFVAAGQLSKFSLPVWLTLPVMLGVVEWLRGYLFTGFPWAAPGLIAEGMGPVLQMASVIGMPGLTVMILLWGVSLGAVLQRCLFAAFILATLPLGMVWGHWRLSSIPTQTVEGPMIRLVQPNISQNDKWRSENSEGIFEDLLTMSASASAEKPGVVIWPESAVSFLLDESGVALSRIADVLEPQQTLLAGSLRRSVDASKHQKYFTSIHMIDDQGRVLESYDKWRLVPGGEYLPFAWALEPLGFRKVVALPESFTAGVGPRSLDVPRIGLAGMLICYEAIFPHRLVDEQQRPRWIVNVTNDGWFGLSVGPHQHLAQVRMRAVEQGLPIARAANTGISAVIDPWGRYVAKTVLETKAVLNVRFPAATAPPFFACWGIVPFWFFVGVVLVAHYLQRWLFRKPSMQSL